MKVPFEWLKEYISTKYTPQEVADLLTAVGLEVEGIENEVLEVALTPNLSHCASIRGIARELSAITEEAYHPPAFTLVEKEGTFTQQEVQISIADPKSCPRYSCCLIQGVKVAESPEWLKKRLERAGMRSINNVADITNLVLLELGQPLHAFDFDAVEDKKIQVRKAHNDESITLIDGKTYDLTQETLLICDAKKPIAVAGVMGALNSEVSANSTTILLESAYFDPSEIRRSAKRLGIKTEASYRFERGVDPNGVVEALNRAAILICEVAGGTLFSPYDISTDTFKAPTLTLRLSRTNQILGTHLAMGEVETLCRRLGFKILRIQEDSLTIQVPTYRRDIKEEIDLIEEVARLYGYDNIHSKEKAYFRTGSLNHCQEYLFSKQIRDLMIAQGLQEFLTCDLIAQTQADWIAKSNFPSRTMIHLLNPQSKDQSIMRPSLLPGLLNVVKCNADHDIHTLSGFEVGRLHFQEKERYFEPLALALVLSGKQVPEHWTLKENNINFFDLKGIVENLFTALKINNVAFEPSHFSNFHPGRQASIKIGNADIGMLGEVHPNTLKLADVKQSVFFAEINLDALRAVIVPPIRMKSLPNFPSSSRDWTATVCKSLAIGTMMNCIEEQKHKLLESVSLLDVYESEALGSDRKNVTLRFVYRDFDKTLSLEEVEEAHLLIVKQVTDKVIIPLMENN